MQFELLVIQVKRPILGLVPRVCGRACLFRWKWRRIRVLKSVQLGFHRRDFDTRAGRCEMWDKLYNCGEVRVHADLANAGYCTAHKSRLANWISMLLRISTWTCEHILLYPSMWDLFRSTVCIFMSLNIDAATGGDGHVLHYRGCSEEICAW